MASVVGISELWGQEPKPLDSVGLPVGEDLGTEEKQPYVPKATDAKGQVKSLSKEQEGNGRDPGQIGERFL